jgi:hypothetical protein
MTIEAYLGCTTNNTTFFTHLHFVFGSPTIRIQISAEAHGQTSYRDQFLCGALCLHDTSLVVIREPVVFSSCFCALRQKMILLPTVFWSLSFLNIPGHDMSHDCATRTTKKNMRTTNEFKSLLQVCRQYYRILKACSLA